MSGPFKMKGFSGFGNSPVKDKNPHTGMNPPHPGHGGEKIHPFEPSAEETSEKIGPAESVKARRKKWDEFDKAYKAAESSRWGVTAESRKAFDVADEASKYKKR